MPRYLFSLLLILLVSFAASAGEGTWRGLLQDGSRITIDPATNKATRTMQGETTPLWNGVHRLNNGAVIIVRDGVVVRDETVINAQRAQAHDRLHAACMQLVTKVCGPHNECQKEPACDPARQLLIMERDELNSNWYGADLESSTLCLEALGNEAYFTPCQDPESDGDTASCERLAEQVCGAGDECDSTQSCRAARQMVAMEQQDLFNAPGTPSPASGQCREALEQATAFFKACDL